MTPSTPVRASTTASSPRYDPDIYYRRFNRRFDAFQTWLAYVFPALFAVVALTQHLSWQMGAIHLLMYLVTIGFRYATRPRDAMLTFIVTYSFWFYSFMLFAYAVVHWQSPEDTLYAPWLASTIAAVTLLSCIGGYVISRLVIRLIGPLKPQRIPTAAERRQTGIGLIAIAAPAMLLPFADRNLNFFLAVEGLFSPVVWLGLIIYCVGRGPKAAFSIPVFAVILTSAIVSVGLNIREMLLSLGVTSTVMYFGLSERPFTMVRMVGMYLVLNMVNAFSAIMIGAREAVGHEKSGAIVLQKIFSSGFVLSAIGLNATSDTSLAIRDELKRSDEYLIYFFGGRSGIFERLTLMPHMDIVTGHLPRYMAIDWGEIRNTFVSALPSIFGQIKETDYSDRLVWSLHLINTDTISHPMVTTPGETYAMGGLIVVASMYILLFLATSLWYEVSKKLFADRFVAAAALLSFSIFIVFSSSAIASLATPMRIYPATLVLYPLINLVWARFAAGRTRPPGQARFTRKLAG